MGPVNWLAVVIATVIAVAIGVLWHGSLFRSGRKFIPDGSERAGNTIVMGVVFLIGAIMLSHNFARIGTATLAARPWLYFMQSGGIAIAFVIPAVWLTHLRGRTEPLRRVIDCAFWLVAYLAIGLVFWLLG